MFETEEIWPVCFDGQCTVGFDQLSEEEKRILELRGLLGLLSDYGLSGEICRIYEVNAEDLDAIAVVEMECRKLAQQKAPKGD